MPQSITFLGAAETVTGSRHLLNLDGHKVLVDCGMFQGSKLLQQRNREPFGFAATELEAVIITHAHQDHIGLLPRLVREGYKGTIYSTKATYELCRISLPDSGRLQEEEARYQNRHGGGPDGRPVTPLYTEREAFETLKQFKVLPYNEFHALPAGAQWRYLPAGHILGSAFAEIYFANGERILMSGDLGRYNTPIIKDPTPVEHAEYLVVESTYGDRLHPREDPLLQLEAVIKGAVSGGSVVLVPSFAIGRTQELLYYLSRLQSEGRIPRIPIYVDSPMATSTTHVFAAATEEFDCETQDAMKNNLDLLDPQGLIFVKDSEQSKALNSARGPMVIIAGSGMANGGRIVHHLLHRLSDPSTIVLFTGYQAEGTLGRRLIDHARHVHILSQQVDVNAQITKLNALSAHADQGEIMDWLKGFKTPPRTTFIVHGEPVAQEALSRKIRDGLGWNVVIPHQAEHFELA